MLRLKQVRLHLGLRRSVLPVFPALCKTQLHHGGAGLLQGLAHTGQNTPGSPMLLLFCSERRLRARQFILHSRQGLLGNLRIHRIRLDLGQPLPGLRQVPLQSGFTLLAPHHRRLGIAQLLMHGRQHVLTRGSRPTDIVEFRPQLHRQRIGFCQPLLRARQHLRNHTIPALRLRQGRPGVRQFLPHHR